MTEFIPDFSVKDVYIEKTEQGVFLVVEHNDGSKHSAVLFETNDVDVGPNTIAIIQQILEKWGNRKISIAEQYRKDRRNESAFLYDLVALAKHVSLLHVNAENLLDVGEGTILMHNRIMAQILHEYENLGYVPDPRPTNFVDTKVHDLNLSDFRCEVKTIQTLGKLENHPLGGMRLTEFYKKSLIAKLRDDLTYAKNQVGDKGIIIIAPWSYKINAILRKCFENILSKFPPPLEPNTTILVLTSRTAFEDLYLLMPTDFVLSIFEEIFTQIEIYGIKGLSFNYISEGLIFRIVTAPVKGSYISMQFEYD